ncbi:MAG: hypothetical protein COT18_00490 [Elusimicrobia bacterium CG08_land_8_20_14_0_20_59_10]|nr:MAG: hypothetical protein COT18_00490 [Elusimicrobia bacterium CG08_land_8_20_14_0_20_59_10]
MPLPSLNRALRMIRAGEGWSAPAAARIKPEIAPAEKEMPWGVKRVNAAAAWDYTADKGVKVAVIDTGMGYNYPDLAANYKGGCNAITPADTPLDDQERGDQGL